MTKARFAVLIGVVCLIFAGGIYAVLSGEKDTLDSCAVSVDTVLNCDRKSQSLTVITADGVKIFEQVYEKADKLPAEIPDEMLFMAKFAGENLMYCEKPDNEEEFKLLEFYEIPSDGLDNCITLYAAEKSIASKNKKLTKPLLWKTASDILTRYGEEAVLRAYMENAYMQNDIWGIEAASWSYFGKSVRFIKLNQKVWLATVMTLGKMPAVDKAQFKKRAEQLAYRLYSNNVISYQKYKNALKEPTYALHQNINLLPEYTKLVMKELKEKRIKTNRQLVVYANINLTTMKAAEDAVQEKLAEYPEDINIAMAVVNYENGGVEALAANDKTLYRTMHMRRQIGSTFKPIVYLAAMKEGAMPNEIIVDKQYRYDQGNYVYAPGNYEDFFMGSIPLRFGLVHSLNNATIRLANITGLWKVSRLAMDLGMNAHIRPYLAMPLGIFPITPLNLAKVYSTFGTYGLKRNIGFINRIEDGKGNEIFVAEPLPVRVSPERETYQVVYMMKDVVRRGTARGSGLINGSAAKTGTTDEYRDAWTVAIFPPYAVVCWVGFDDHRSMGDEGTGGGRAAPVIAAFQKKIMPKVKKIDFKVPQGIVFKRVDTRTGMLADGTCKSRRSYTEAFLEERVPKSCGEKNMAFETKKKDNGS